MTPTLRDHWQCPTCGAGVCLPTGQPPDPLEHRISDGLRPRARVCGVYVLVATGLDCFAEGRADLSP